ncbi:MAG: hypothetical protein ACLFUH_10890 [Bacteroidales bacterium]
MDKITNSFDIFLIFSLALVFIVSIFSIATSSVSKTVQKNVSVETNLSNNSNQIIDLNDSVIKDSEVLFSDYGNILEKPSNYSINYSSGRIVLRSYMDDKEPVQNLNMEYLAVVSDTNSISLIDTAIELFKSVMWFILPAFFFVLFVIMVYYAKNHFIS